MKKTAAVAALLLALAAPSAMAAKSPPKFKTCKAMHAKAGYKNGVGLDKATDSTSGKPVTNFRRDYRSYLVNAARDRDKDGVACERHIAKPKPVPVPTTTTTAPVDPAPTASPAVSTNP